MADPNSQAVDSKPNSYEESSLIAFVVVITVVSTLAVVLRFVSRSLSKTGSGSGPGVRSRFWYDDWLALAALPLLYAFAGLHSRLIHLGLGKHTSTLPPQNQVDALLTIFIEELLYNIVLTVLREAVVFFYSRVFRHGLSTKLTTWTLYLLHFLNIAWLIHAVVVLLVQCSPVKKFWDKSTPGICHPQFAVWVSGTSSSVFIDFLILLFPMPHVWRLKMSRRRKLALTVIFVLGYCTIVVSIGRLITIIDLGEKLDTDVFYNWTSCFYYFIGEAALMEFAICLPAMTPLARRLLDRSRTKKSQPSRFESNPTASMPYLSNPSKPAVSYSDATLHSTTHNGKNIAIDEQHESSSDVLGHVLSQNSSHTGRSHDSV